MLSRRYTIVVADRRTGVVRRFTISSRLLLGVAVCALGVPVLLGLGARWSLDAEVAHLQANNRALYEENQSFRQATGELTLQIGSLQSAVGQLGERAKVDPAAAAAMKALPSAVTNRALGGSPNPTSAARTAVSTALTTPENTFGVLRNILDVLESRLRTVSSDVDRWQALSRATPSVWPAFGWLTDRFGNRRDPFTGAPDNHLGLDIDGEKGDPVFATADGLVESAGYTGAYGNLVVLQHDFGMTTRYAHLSRMAVKPGERVTRGTLIGHVGSTGRSSGPHLHYEVWANGRPLNPLKLLTSQPGR